MPLIAYREQRFNSKARKTVEQAKSIIDDLKAQGYVLTLRQLYYQFVSRNWIANTEQEYKRLGRIVCDAREVGEIDWLDIEDRGRQAMLHGHVDSPEKVLEGIEHALRLNPWLEQEAYCEVWVEKAALEGVIARPANRWRAPYMACKGYLSVSEMWRAGRRFERAIAEGKRPVLIHLGDHDPSGLHMTEDSETRLSLFARMGVDVRRIALNMDQVEQYDPPENPAKQTDSRFAGYTSKFKTDKSWELDALLPSVIDGLIDAELQKLLDRDKWDATLRREAEDREPLRLLGFRWEEVRELMLSDEHPLERLRALDEVTWSIGKTLRRAAPVQAERLAAADARRAYVRPDPKDDAREETEWSEEALDVDVSDPFGPELD